MAQCGLGQEQEQEDFHPDFKEYMERELKYSRLCESPDKNPDYYWEGINMQKSSLLCEYRMRMCREYNNYFYADAQSGEEQLGLPGRVFLNQLPESTPDVEHYSLKEYPQRDLALEYMERELSRLETSDKPPPGFESDLPKRSWEGIGWVFWNRQDDDDLSANMAAHCLATNNLRGPLPCNWFSCFLVEFRQVLPLDAPLRDYNSFYADAESGEEQLGLPGRVFLNQLPESTPKLEHYILKEYPQRKLAIRCCIKYSWGLPVFECSNHTCVGVLEIVCVETQIWHNEEFQGRLNDIFQSVVTAERNIPVVSSSKEGKRKMRGRKHQKGGPRIDIPIEEILKCSDMYRDDAAAALNGGLEAIATIKAINTGWLHPTINQCNLESDVTFDTVPNVKKEHEVHVGTCFSPSFRKL
ncbi:hypothetical protein C3L33_16230, partial [Rhododendron williamsianum]